MTDSSTRFPRLTRLVPATLAVACVMLFPTMSIAQQRPASFVDAATVVPGLVVEMRYLTANNFVGAPIDGYQKPICYLTRPAAAALAAVARELEPRGLVVKPRINVGLRVFREVVAAVGLGEGLVERGRAHDEPRLQQRGQVKEIALRTATGPEKLVNLQDPHAPSLQP